MASMRVIQLSAQRVSITRMYVVIEMVAGQRTTRHHWPIFVFAGAVKENLHAVVRGNAACEYVDPRVVIFLYTLKHEKHHTCEYVDPRVVIFLYTLKHEKHHTCEYVDPRVVIFLHTLNHRKYHACEYSDSRVTFSLHSK